MGYVMFCLPLTGVVRLKECATVKGVCAAASGSAPVAACLPLNGMTSGTIYHDPSLTAPSAASKHCRWCRYCEQHGASRCTCGDDEKLCHICCKLDLLTPPFCPKGTVFCKYAYALHGAARLECGAFRVWCAEEGFDKVFMAVCVRACARACKRERDR